MIFVHRVVFKLGLQSSVSDMWASIFTALEYERAREKRAVCFPRYETITMI